ncbi:carbohydrate ABC transporter permease [Rhodococcus sp. BP-149]|uniref:carbohydrate ABC transporter permease n=1 Tax=unclassified Rhodococcus (in: high G+C Gram-positive bacteria) TaxID=192944 RepID=UPI001C9A7BC6|nr:MULTISPECIES: carbohydrate ABC transporter permease [unclassified Rhodococcus (in: high G+C Gram-positive bacteria)]MBY6684661.1 carbohydrate ABC transporter permease [Rhodococcus sp. BP-288]MBY6692855.1 carbohydrate ABC transporter permease [Rhodococcus sp. BP-188]MBY6698753.1 carbohydrate ABC transporter permease [Rhodococcus sp. BP-285]MBY6701432.1 carbohydrate ABC transporter permease [Rhodococcus sp. BP-283]MBY6712433.1 carbohydrate ABC transporter permease [Rhodococcus sp. BP-160]
MSVIDRAPAAATADDARPARDAARRRRLSTLFGYAAMVVVIVIIGLPLFWIVVTSFKERGDIYVQPSVWWPAVFRPENYDEATTTVPFWTFLKNSLIITSILAVVKFALGVLSAYGLVFLRFPGKTIVFLVIIAALMVPNQITVISNYALVAQLGWRNTFQGIIVPLAGVAFGTFLMRNHFLSIPQEIIEAARMDAAGPVRLLFRVVLPLSGPTMVAFATITVVNEWNEYLWPFLMSDDSSVAPLPVGLTQLQNNDGVTNWGPVMAGTVLTMLPILVVFLALQRHMIKGLTSGAVKG